MSIIDNGRGSRCIECVWHSSMCRREVMQRVLLGAGSVGDGAWLRSVRVHPKWLQNIWCWMDGFCGYSYLVQFYISSHISGKHCSNYGRFLPSSLNLALLHTMMMNLTKVSSVCINVSVRSSFEMLRKKNNINWTWLE